MSTVREASDQQLLVHHASLESDFEFFPLLTVGMDLHAIERELARRGFKRVTDRPPWWRFLRGPSKRWARVQEEGAVLTPLGVACDRLVEFWDGLEDGFPVGGLVQAIRILVDITAHAGLADRLRTHTEAQRGREAP
jgi:hypothetical protein